MTDRKIRIGSSSTDREVIEFLRAQLDRLGLDPIEEDVVRRLLDVAERDYYSKRAGGALPLRAWS